MSNKKIIFSLIMLFLIIILSGYALFTYLPKDNQTFKEETKEETNIKENEYQNKIQEILTYEINPRIDNNFLEWLYHNYSIESIEHILNDLKNNTFSLESFYQATHNSFIVLQDLYLNNYQNVDNVTVINKDLDEITLSFIGDVSLADNYQIMPKYTERQAGIKGILDDGVIDILNKADITIANNEFTISTRGTPLKNKTFTFRANPDNLKVYTEMGVDLVTLANNHVYDFGEEAFLDMLDALDNFGMPHIGAGKNINEASKPYYFVIMGRKIAFVNASRAEKNIMTPGATETSSGVLRCYNPDKFIETIKEAKSNSDYVIALVHWGKENYHTLEDEQIETAKMYIDAGADAIVGSHAHVLQGMEFYKDKLIAYNLGDFIFSKKTKDTGILNINIKSDGTFNYYFKACLEENEYTKLLDNEEKLKVLKDMESYSVNALFKEDGQIIPK